MSSGLKTSNNCYASKWAVSLRFLVKTTFSQSHQQKTTLQELFLNMGADKWAVEFYTSEKQMAPVCLQVADPPAAPSCAFAELCSNERLILGTASTEKCSAWFWREGSLFSWSAGSSVVLEAKKWSDCLSFHGLCVFSGCFLYVSYACTNKGKTNQVISCVMGLLPFQL